MTITRLSDVGTNESRRTLAPGGIRMARLLRAVFIGQRAAPHHSAALFLDHRAQASHRLAPHTHPDERTVTVLSGTYWSGVGETFADDKLQAFPAGSFYVVPAGIPHFSAVLDGEVEFQEAGVGPSAHDLVTPPGGVK